MHFFLRQVLYSHAFNNDLAEVLNMLDIRNEVYNTLIGMRSVAVR